MYGDIKIKTYANRRKEENNMTKELLYQAFKIRLHNESLKVNGEIDYIFVVEDREETSKSIIST